ncbi:helix-turn-helix domain-containing protein [Phytopseudomonas dryadis]|uniref:Transcriptional regulator n=1 Tax=Phytopseudomonas dryadis TaxID=2487520 RepID=A0A4V2KBJ9_9GAMM|nr:MULTISPECIES: helix-turn-helix transcriptional regulator [Pseudomonas]TBU86693.1 transcriptional regulator [Pseudomonas dryadis]TBV05446.1 transcriptional regulator [Pseudomonas dryadis]TBV18455.1 transcriptional regulator [Pseudomonas sp. FRB 230]
MNVQVIERDGEPEYAVLPWAEYRALLQAAGRELPAPRIEPPPTQAPASLAELRARREDKGLSREELARAVGISPHYLGMIESGERQPDAAILRALAWVLGVSAWEPGR